MKEKSCFKYNLIKLVAYAILAVLIFVFRDNLVAHNGLKYFIGGLMLLYAMEEILFIVLHHVHHLFHEDKVYLSLGYRINLFEKVAMMDPKMILKKDLKEIQ